MYRETCLIQALNEIEYFINRAFKGSPMYQIFLNLTRTYKVKAYLFQNQMLALRRFGLDRIHCNTITNRNLCYTIIMI